VTSVDEEARALADRPVVPGALRKLGKKKVRMIIRTTDDPKNHLDEIEKQGLEVHQVFKLIKAVSVEGPASKAISLAGQGWIRQIEEDREVGAQSRSKSGRKR
jgi:hypothetical protein